MGRRVFLQALKLVHPGPATEAAAKAARVEIAVEFSLKGALLSIHFQVRSPYAVTVNSAMPTADSQWGLWDWDVVEIFLSCARGPARLPYYEFQVSPLGQRFELEIFEPRRKFDRDFRSGFRSSVQRAGAGDWQADLVIPLDRLGWDGDPESLTGNAFAILGPKEARTYWSLFLDPQDKPDFHLPGEFRHLLF